MLCLGIETSCDETALALVQDGRCVDAVLASQADVHALFGGVVPELASREHYRFCAALYDALMDRSGLRLTDVDVIAVTRGPGLLGALLVGVAFAKGLAFASGKPLVGVNHLQAHLLATTLEHAVSWPALGLLVSGGHTHIYRLNSPTHCELLGRTLDDAAGEACDKFAKMLGLPYPGGALLDALARRGTADVTRFPRPYTRVDNLDFSFSGLKTAACTWLDKNPSMRESAAKTCALVEGTGKAASWTRAIEQADADICDLCASFLSAVSDTLRIKLEMALNRHPNEFCSLLVAGGVAANTQVREAMSSLSKSSGVPLYLPSLRLCTDNAIMVAHAGALLAQDGKYHDLTLSAVPRGQYIPQDFLASGF